MVLSVSQTAEPLGWMTLLYNSQGYVLSTSTNRSLGLKSVGSMHPMYPHIRILTYIPRKLDIVSISSVQSYDRCK